MNPKYLKDPRLHLRHLKKFRQRVTWEILGQDDQEYRSELQFLLERTDETINEVKEKIL
jgi:type II secretory pathway predicted ATPase ExeA